MSSDSVRNLSPNRIGKEEFVSTVADMAEQVWDFHNRWGFGSGSFDGVNPSDVIIERREILAEEIRELDEAVSSGDDEEVCDEAGDVLFVALGHVEALGRSGLRGVGRVTVKNSLKTGRTHAIRADTGKLLPKEGKPHKWE